MVSHVASLEQIKNELKKNKTWLQEKYHISNIGIFGSYARGEECEESGVDIMVELQRPMGLDFVVLAEELESILKRRVDLVSLKAIKQNHL
jgi:predicted nucleotidyltransferase